MAHGACMLHAWCIAYARVMLVVVECNINTVNKPKVACNIEIEWKYEPKVELHGSRVEWSAEGNGPYKLP